MKTYAVEANGQAIGIAAAPTPDAALGLIRSLLSAGERARADSKARMPVFSWSVRAANALEMASFDVASLAGEVRLAGIVLPLEKNLDLSS